MIYFEGKKKSRCETCGGRAFTVNDGWEYICSDCKGIGYHIKTVLVDMKTLVDKIGEKLDGK